MADIKIYKGTTAPFFISKSIQSRVVAVNMAINAKGQIIKKDNKPLNFIRHPQRTSFWKRFIMFFKRPKMDEKNFDTIILNK